ncbi:D-TA family PLP-dependent enzyme [Roseiflexus castenholzii]|uniref:D-TA family PLP-dependent enzyme n=1 Tax=Roseiflexus castenholzii TaxID=120962 RepID=UPI003C7E1E15
MRIDDLDTPAVVIDLDRLEANIARFQAYLDRHGIANRPHIKTHKIPQIAQMQIAAGAVGITCQKLGEAEVMADAGITDIFLPYNILGAAKLERLVTLARRVQVSVTADSPDVVTGLGAAMSGAGLELPVLVECDTGMGRCGVQNPAEAAELAFQIARTPGLRFGGLMTYPSSPAIGPFMREAVRLLRERGLPVERVSGGGTAGMWHAHEHPEVTEYRAGMYVYGDRYTLRAGALRLEECAMSVLTTVVSRPTPDRGVIDGGSKTFSSDLLGLEGYGLILEYPEARIVNLSEEHGVVDFSQCAQKPAIGERVRVLPNHCCVVSNLFDELIGARRGEVETIWRVAARGTVR